jgi:hypothetical protein
MKKENFRVWCGEGEREKYGRSPIRTKGEISWCPKEKKGHEIEMNRRLK